jgi:hypothetical protein
MTTDTGRYRAVLRGCGGDLLRSVRSTTTTLFPLARGLDRSPGGCNLKVASAPRFAITRWAGTPSGRRKLSTIPISHGPIARWAVGAVEGA